MTASEYLSERVLYGGLWTTRSEMIRHLRSVLPSEKCVGMYLMGFDSALGRTLKAKKEGSRGAA